MIEEKDDILSVVGEALTELGRNDEVYSYGVVDEGGEENRRQLIYFDLPRISPLQFNLSIRRDLSRSETIELIKEAIKSRIDIADASKTFEL